MHILHVWTVALVDVRRALLLKEGLEEINKSKRARYEAWRRRMLGGIKLGRKLRKLFISTLIPAVVCLQVRRVARWQECAVSMARAGRAAMNQWQVVVCQSACVLFATSFA